MSVHKKLMQARIALQGTRLEKTGLNKFAGYKYFELGDFIPTVQTIFDGLGLCGVISYGLEVATLEITDTDDGTSLSVTSPMSTAALKGCHEVQNLGAVETYIRRYLWVTALEIVEHDAIDASQVNERQPDIAAILRGITGSATLDVLRANYDAAVSMLDESHHPAIKKATAARKHELTNLKESA